MALKVWLYIMGWALLDRGDRRADVQGSLY